MKIEFDNIWASIVDLKSKEIDALNRVTAEVTVESPGARFVKSHQLYLQTRGKRGWDGQVCLIKRDERFLSGLLPKVVASLAKYGVVSELIDLRDGNVGASGEVKVDLRDYQWDALKSGTSNMFHNTWWPRGVFKMATGCVDGDTEYLSPVGWRKIKKYDGEQVAQYHDDGSISWVTPSAYIKKECDEFYHLKTKYGIDQAISAEHRVVYIPNNKNYNIKEINCADLVKKHDANKFGFSGRFISSFKRGIRFPSYFQLPEKLLRVQVAVIADGTFDNRTSTNTCVIRLRKKRKKDRLEKLLREAEIYYTKKSCEPVGFHKFTFQAPIKLKEFDETFLSCTNHQLAIICDEVLKWDGNGVNQFYTSSKKSADFIQFAFTARNKRASITFQDRRDTTHRKIEYKVHISSKIYPSLQSTTKSCINKIPSSDGYKYCFTVPTGKLVLRRNNNIFVTGNSGKTELAVALYQYLNVPTLFLVHKKTLVNQAVKRFKSYGIDAGQLGDGTRNWNIGGITVATIQTLSSLLRRKESLEELKDIRQVFFDEAHLIAADVTRGNTFVSIAGLLPSALIRWGMTATPFMKDTYSNMLLEGVTGGVLYEIKSLDLIKMGYLTPPEIHMVDVPKTPKLPRDWANAYSSGIVLNTARNKIIVEQMKKAPSPGFVLCNNVDHAEIIKAHAEKAGFKNLPILNYRSSTGLREATIADMVNGKHKFVICTKIFDEGLDVPELKSVILAGGGKSEIKSLQRLGRLLRRDKSKEKVRLVDFQDQTGVLKRHANQRRKTWESEGFEVIS